MFSVSPRTRTRMTLRAATALLAFTAITPLAVAQGSADARANAERHARGLFYEGRCDEALPELSALRAAQDDAPLALIEAQCRIQARDYTGALSALDDAARIDPDLDDVELYRGVALYQLEELGEARQALALARGHTSERASAQLELYSGLLQLQDDEPRLAAESLDRARVIDAAQVEPIASFYAALAWQSAGERELARESLLRVKAADPDGAWGKRAEELLAGRSLEDRSWASLLAGLEYDSNVVLLGDSVPAPQGISDQADGRGVWYLEGGAELFHKNKWSGGLAATYAGNAQFDLSQFDIQYPRANTWVDYEFDPKHIVRFRYGIGYAWVGYDDFLFNQDGSITLYKNWGAQGNTEIGTAWNWNDYKFPIEQVPNGTGAPGSVCVPGAPLAPPLPPCAPPGVNSQQARNRDGNSVNPFIAHRYRVPGVNNDWLRDVELRGEFAYQHYWAHGADWDFNSYDFALGTKALLIWDLHFDTSFVYSYRPYLHGSSYPTPPTFFNIEYALSPFARVDNIYLFVLSLEKPITDHVSVSTRYIYNRNDSTVAVFNFDRNIIGGYVKYRF